MNLYSEEIPQWLPCFSCGKALSAHIDSKCPFEASNFVPSDTKMILSALYEMRRMQATRSRQAHKKKITDGNFAEEMEKDYRLAMDIVMDRWLKEQGLA